MSSAPFEHAGLAIQAARGKARRSTLGSGCALRLKQVKRAATHSQVAAACKALGDENRLLMLHMILDAGELCACEIERHFDLSQPTISHHLKLLRNARLIAGERRGTWVYYRAVKETVRALAEHPVFNPGGAPRKSPSNSK